MSSTVSLDLEHTQMALSIGITIGAIFTGGTIVLSISCLFLLSSNTGGSSKRNLFLRAYITALLLAIIGLELAYLLAANSFAVFHVHSIVELAKRQGSVLSLFISITPVIVIGITDGLLVWRCYAVHQVFEQTPSRWRNIFWILPALLWLLNMGTNVFLPNLYDSSSTCVVSGILAAPIAQLPLVYAVTLISNIVLNTYASLFIAVRMLQYRRIMIRCIGAGAPAARYVYIVGLLLESAAINVPVAFAAAIGLCVPGTIFGPAMGPVVGSGQALASILIIHQVALGKAFDQQKERESAPEMTEGRVWNVTNDAAEEVA
ncbi:hypothetical protein P691DRAFT_830567 [Macrolepiota fuliginosa MF-IS2]|uniref:Uncharacterized protein n=1 Tax=Macrolepiota fuliginosa MF-IS2 TaxID=1400762 RepID=A0A9P5XAL6_9AGAR|nr:hypothetical protein P691DRAFT_830567 [Macrolepiota fuliginosa MF-IS2]